MEIKLVGTLDIYTVAELPAFHRKTEKQVILVRIHLCVNPSDVVLTGILTNSLLKHSFRLFIYVTLLLMHLLNNYLTFSCFYKH